MDICTLYSGESVSRLARALLAKKIGKGAPIAIYADLSPRGIALLLASIRLGLKVAICHPREPGAVIEAWLLKLGINTLVSSVRLPPHYCPSLESYFTDDLPVHKDDKAVPDLSDEFISILRTSGTGAEPRSAFIKMPAHQNSALNVNSYFKFGVGAVWALSLPLAHVSGLSIVLRALQSGGSIFIAPDHQTLVSGIRAGALSHCSIVPAQLKRLLDEEVDCALMRALIVGGDRLEAHERDQAAARGWPLFECYGMTETASMIAVRDAKKPARWSILPHAEIKHGKDQELLIRSSSLFSGYWQEGQLVLPLTADGFFASGDIVANLDLEKSAIICRKNNRIISGGENIQAEEIEAVLERHPLIQSAVVIGVVDPRMGMRPVAYIKWRADPLPKAMLEAFLQDKLAPYKWPDQFFSWPSSLLASLKKPRRSVLEHHHLQ